MAAVPRPPATPPTAVRSGTDLGRPGRRHRRPAAPGLLRRAPPHLRRRRVRRLGGGDAGRRPAVPGRVLEPGPALPAPGLGWPTCSGSAPLDAPGCSSVAAGVAARGRHLPGRPGGRRPRRRAPRRRARRRATRHVPVGHRPDRRRRRRPSRSPPSPMLLAAPLAGRRHRPAGGVARPRRRRHHLGEGAARAGDPPGRARPARRPAARADRGGAATADRLPPRAVAAVGRRRRVGPVVRVPPRGGRRPHARAPTSPRCSARWATATCSSLVAVRRSCSARSLAAAGASAAARRPRPRLTVAATPLLLGAGSAATVLVLLTEHPMWRPARVAARPGARAARRPPPPARPGARWSPRGPGRSRTTSSTPGRCSTRRPTAASSARGGRRARAPCPTARWPSATTPASCGGPAGAPPPTSSTRRSCASRPADITGSVAGRRRRQPDVCAVVVRSAARWGSFDDLPDRLADAGYEVADRGRPVGRRALPQDRLRPRPTGPSGRPTRVERCVAGAARVSGSAAEAVEVAEAGGGVDDLGERHPLGREVEQHEHDEHAGADRPAGLEHDRQARARRRAGWRRCRRASAARRGRRGSSPAVAPTTGASASPTGDVPGRQRDRDVGEQARP